MTNDEVLECVSELSQQKPVWKFLLKEVGPGGVTCATCPVARYLQKHCEPGIQVARIEGTWPEFESRHLYGIYRPGRKKPIPLWHSRFPGLVRFLHTFDNEKYPQLLEDEL